MVFYAGTHNCITRDHRQNRLWVISFNGIKPCILDFYRIQGRIIGSSRASDF
ncbi:hypothetical protein M413DRAFT_259830 [Hebeloma cylindrosporum]|uniref:Uncharacterized protein n=1 Tax=Hebeloma cylindrosporum TaxID=76867 RepID=A0A0C2YA04_HEBCY|nr:hypothetical protein M413DRAFT_259830 [Hebeloma cylindrosporum h7]